MNNKTYFLYAIRTREAVKLGYSIDPEKRLKQLQIGSPHQMHVAWVSLPLVGSQRAKAKERQLHKALSQHHMHGEWFSLEALSAIQNEAVNVRGIFGKRKDNSEGFKREHSN